MASPWLSGETCLQCRRNAADVGSILGSGRSPGGDGNPLQYSCLGKPTDRGGWWARVHRVTKSQTQLKWLARTHTRPLWDVKVKKKKQFFRRSEVRKICCIWFYIVMGRGTGSGQADPLSGKCMRGRTRTVLQCLTIWNVRFFVVHNFQYVFYNVIEKKIFSKTRRRKRLK